MKLIEAQQQGIAPWDDIIHQEEHFTIFRDRYPVTPGHVLFVPHHDDTWSVANAMEMAYKEGLNLVEQGDCDGYNVGMNMGPAAGQTVMYPHIHLIPRRQGDCNDPVGGVRGVVPGQANYRKSQYQTPQ